MKGSFDPTRAVEFDLPRGTVEGGGERLLVVPASLLSRLAQTSGSGAALAAAKAIGAACGARVAGRLGGEEAVRAASVESVAAHLAGELAVSGVGVVRLERWGRALVVVVAHAAIADDACLAGLIEAAIGAATGRAVAATTIARDGAEVRVLVAGHGAVERAKAVLSSGASWGEVLARVQSGGGG